ncbi:MAG: hypothetical protein ACOC22_03850 [bacterium]
MFSIQNLFEDKKPELKEGQYAVPLRKKKKKKALNPKTNRMKNKKLTQWLVTKVKPEDRTLKNLPKYADGRPKVTFEQWLELKKSPVYYNKLNNVSWGWSPNGKCYGWSHRAIGSFSIGDEVKEDTIGNFKGGRWKIKTNEEAERMAKEFAKDVS